MRLVRGINSGKLVFMISNSSSRDTWLNIFVRSMNSAARVGSLWFFCGVLMWRSIDSCMDLMMTSMPPLTPTA